MKQEKIVALIGLKVMFSIGAAMIISVVIFYDMANPITAYELWIGIVMIILSLIFIWKTLQKKG